MVQEGQDLSEFIHQFDVQIPKPITHTEKISEDAVKTWLAEEKDVQFRAVKEKLVNSITNISFEDFSTRLNETVEGFNKIIGDDEYLVLWDGKPHGSKRWVYSLARPMLDKEPIFSTYNNKKPERIIDLMQQNEINTIVVFDDVVYTGDQLSDHVYKGYWEELFKRKPNKPMKLIVVAPYISENFKIMAKKSWNDKVITTILAPSQTVPQIWDILNKNEQDILFGHNNLLNESMSFPTDDDIRSRRIYIGSTTTTFDHKISDSTSLCRPLLASIGFNVTEKREPYSKVGTPYYELEKKEYGWDWRVDF